MSLSRSVSEISGNFSRKSQNFVTQVYLNAPAEGFPLQLGIGVRDRKLK